MHHLTSDLHAQALASLATPLLLATLAGIAIYLFLRTIRLAYRGYIQLLAIRKHRG